VTDQQTVVPTDETLTLRLGWRQAVEALSLPALGLLVLVVVVSGFIGSGPLDYRLPGFLLVLALALMVLTAPVPLSVFRQKVGVTLTPEGIRGIARWLDVTGLTIVSRRLSPHLRVDRAQGPAVTLAAPQGSWWRRDAEFDRDVALVYEYAVRHGAPVTAPARRRPLRRAFAAGVVLAGVLTGTGLYVAHRHVIWPWTPEAVAFPRQACDALRELGINEIWPPQQRELDTEFTDDDAFSTYSGCRFTVASGHYRDSRFGSLMVTVARQHGDVITSPVASAIRVYRSDRANMQGTQALPGLGDEAFVGRWATMTRFEGRRADVVIQVQLRSDTGGPVDETGRRLLADLLGRVRTG
jgi:hypothetical protein